MKQRGYAKKKFLIILLFFFAFLTVFSQIREVRRSRARGFNEVLPFLGKALDLRARSLDGKSVELRDFRGKWVILTFWASWCSPCRQELPELDLMINEWSKKKGANLKVAFLAVNSTESVETVRKYWGSVGFLHGVPLLSQEDDAKSLGIEGFPTIFLLDPKGIVRRQEIGYRASFLSDLEREIFNSQEAQR